MIPAAIAATLFAMAGCERAPDEPAPAERADSAGIQIVTNRGPDRPLALTFTKRFVLGGKDEGPESFFRVATGDVGIDGAGNIYILDAQAKRIVIFDSTGKFVRTLGSRGAGPGEMQLPSTVHVSRSGEVFLHDVLKEGLIRWAPDGSVQPSVRPRATSSADDVAITDDGIIYSWGDYESDTTVIRTRLGLERGDSVIELASVQLPRPGRLAFANCAMGFSLPPLFSPDIRWTAGGSRIASASGAAYDIQLYQNGKRARIRRDVAPQPATGDLARREVGDSMRIVGGSMRCAIPPEEVARVRGYAPVLPTIRSIMIAPDGALWVRRMAPRREPAPIDLFDPDGDYLGTLPDTAPMPIAFFPNGDIAAVERDADSDVERVVVYSVSKVPAG
jgi:hypothetical protein